MQDCAAKHEFDKILLSSKNRDNCYGGKFVTDYLNEDLDLVFSSFIVRKDHCVIPIQYERVMLENISLTCSDHDQIKSLEMTFTDKSEILIAEETNYCDYDGKVFPRCHFYFSPECSSNAAATCYFLLSSMCAMCNLKKLKFSEVSIDKLASFIIQRFGKALTPSDKSKFWNEFLNIPRKMYIADHSTDSEITELDKDEWSLLDGYFDTVGKEVKLLYVRKNKQLCASVFKQQLSI